MLKNRVYVESEKDAPDDAILREGKRGRLYYKPDERGNNQHVGGEKDNSLLNDDLDKQENLSEGEVFYDTENQTEIVITEVEGGDVQVTTGSHEWTEDAESATENIENGSWVHLPDEERKVERQEEDPCWDGYEMAGTKVQDGEEVPNCVPKAKVDRVRELAAEKESVGKEFEGPEGQEFGDFQGCVDVVGDWDNVDDPEAACAQWHYDDTGEWPGEKGDEQEKVYIGSVDEAPDGVIIERDSTGLFYRQQAYEMVSDDYPDDIEDDVEDAGVDLPEAEDADGTN